MKVLPRCYCLAPLFDFAPYFGYNPGDYNATAGRSQFEASARAICRDFEFAHFRELYARFWDNPTEARNINRVMWLMDMPNHEGPGYLLPPGPEEDLSEDEDEPDA